MYATHSRFAFSPVFAVFAVDADVATLKEFFRMTIGSTWAEATRPTTTLKVTIGTDRQKRPWKEIDELMRRRDAEAPHAYVRKYVSQMTQSFFAWRP